MSGDTIASRPVTRILTFTPDSKVKNNFWTLTAISRLRKNEGAKETNNKTYSYKHIFRAIKMVNLKLMTHLHHSTNSTHREQVKWLILQVNRWSKPWAPVSIKTIQTRRCLKSWLRTFGRAMRSATSKCGTCSNYPRSGKSTICTNTKICWMPWRRCSSPIIRWPHLVDASSTGNRLWESAGSRKIKMPKRVRLRSSHLFRPSNTKQLQAMLVKRQWCQLERRLQIIMQVRPTRRIIITLHQMKLIRKMQLQSVLLRSTLNNCAKLVPTLNKFWTTPIHLSCIKEVRRKMKRAKQMKRSVSRMKVRVMTMMTRMKMRSTTLKWMMTWANYRSSMILTTTCQWTMTTPSSSL